jgi:tetratricopeptide (TPR) repeat protein
VHGRLCDVFNRDEPSDWRVLASHCECAERYHEAAVAYEHTAEWARRRGALEEARSHLARAIELVEQLPADSARDHLDIELRLRRGFIAMSSEGAASPQASADFDRCLELAGPEPQSDDMFSTLISVWAYYLSRGELARTRQVSETLRAGLDRGRDYFRPQNLAGFGMLDWFAGDFRSALDTLTAATDQLAAMGREDEVEAVWFVPNDPTTAMHAHLGLARFMAGDASGADASVAQARAAAAECDFPQAPWSDCYATWLGSWMWLEAGRLEIARRAMADLDATSARHGFDTWELISATHSATLDAVVSMDAGAADVADRADALEAYLELWQGLGLRVFLPYYLTVAGRARAASGQVEEARRRYQESLQLAEETGMRFYDAETARCLALLAGDQDDRIAELQAALELARAQRARPFESRIALELRLVGEEITQR